MNATAGPAPWFEGAGPRELVLRRLLLALHVPPVLLTILGTVLPPAQGERWQRFVSRLVPWREARRRSTRDEWRRATRGVPVLLYHAFGDEPSRFAVSPRTFARQIRVLSLLRFRVVPYGELVDAMREERLPERTIVLTIDDGNIECREAAEELARHGFGATLFVIAGRLGGTNDRSRAGAQRGGRLLSATDLLELRARGVEIGAHSCSHVPLSELDERAIEGEVTGSREVLERTLGEQVRMFAYPYGRYDERVVEAVRRAGFESACTVDQRPAQVDDDPLLVPRLAIERSDSLLRFLVKAGVGWA